MAKIKKVDLKETEELAALGLTHAQIAHALGIGQTTFYDRKKNCEDFEAAIKRGEARGIVHVTNKLREQIDEGNTTATIFFLKAKAGWKETQVIENNHGLQPLKSLSELFENRAKDGEKTISPETQTVNSEVEVQNPVRREGEQ